MQAYLVRMKADESGASQLVGFFVAPNRDALAQIVDECCDVDAVEVAEIKAGGIYWPSQVARTIPILDDEFETTSILPPEPFVSDSWADAMMTNDLRWTALQWGDAYPNGDNDR
jgi:hypothetical protein